MTTARYILLFALCLPPAITSYKLSHYGRRPHVCQPIQEETCAKFKYNVTYFPNIFDHESQAEASERLREFEPLLRSNCSHHLHFFLCTLHFPLCSSKVNVAIPACREMCEDVREKCSKVMRMVDKKWSIPCNRLPYKGEKMRLCMLPPEMTDEQDDVIPTKPLLTKVHESDEKGKEGGSPVIVDYYPVGEEDHVTEEDGNRGSDDQVNTAEAYDSLEPVFHDGVTTEVTPKCRNPMKFRFIETMNKGECLPRCSENMDVLFSSHDKRIAYWLLTLFATICFVSTSTSILTFAIDSHRFRYPERPIIFLSLCYLIYSSAYLVRAFGGPSSSLSCHGNHEEGHLVKGGLGGSGCTAVFFLLYYFGMAASAWWVVLALTWLLSAGFKWAHEAIEAYSYYYHLVAWSVPAAQTMVVLITAKMDGDELTGLCYVGNLEPDSLMYFVIMPLTFYLLMGTAAVILGFGNLFKIRRAIKQQCDNALNLEKLMLRIGLFSVLYVVPVTCVIVVNFYQYQNFSNWMAHAEKMRCVTSQYRTSQYVQYNSYAPPGGLSVERNPTTWDYIESDHAVYPYGVYDNIWESNENSLDQYLDPAGGVTCMLDKSIPSLPIFAIKIFMSLVAGAASGMWVWNKKTYESWKKFANTFRKCRGVSLVSSNDLKIVQNSKVDDRQVEHADEQNIHNSRLDISYSMPTEFGHKHLIIPAKAYPHPRTTQWRPIQNLGGVGQNSVDYNDVIQLNKYTEVNGIPGNSKRIVNFVENPSEELNRPVSSLKHHCKHSLSKNDSV